MSTRATALAASLAIGLLWITLLSVLFPRSDRDENGMLPPPRERIAEDLLLDRNTESFVYPFTLQNLMWLVFFVAAGELFVRNAAGNREEDQLRLGLLPEDDETLLRRKDNIGAVYRRVRQSDPEQEYWLQRLLTGALLQFQSSGSIDQVNAVFNTSMELYQHEIDLRYNLLRYLVWLIPTLGFVGTVIGIALALATAGGMFSDVTANTDMAALGPRMMTTLTSQLGVAFYTTLLALLQSAGLMLALHLVQGREETALNHVAFYCLRNLVNRLYERRS